jgi:orotate phosphoribosyltransferase
MTDDGGLQEEIGRLLPSRRGHFLLESGHHGELWLDLERLCLDPRPVRRLAELLACRLAPHGIEVVCGPLVEGAFVALMVASELGLPFTYSERIPGHAVEGLYPMDYRLPTVLREAVGGKRVAIVNDVVNAGSAVRATFVDLTDCGGKPVAIGTLAVLGDSASRYAAEKQVALETLASFPSALWAPGACPSCAQGIPLDR